MKIHSTRLRTREFHIFIKQHQQARRALPRPGWSERGTGCEFENSNFDKWRNILIWHEKKQGSVKPTQCTFKQSNLALCVILHLRPKYNQTCSYFKRSWVHDTQNQFYLLIHRFPLLAKIWANMLWPQKVVQHHHPQLPPHVQCCW